MVAKNWRSLWQLLKFLFIFSGIDFLDRDSLQAQIVPDKTLGAESSQINRVNGTRDRIEGGATRGSNLFHSFKEFSISEGRAAYFANPAAIRTIFSRVTGNNPSKIFGTLGVEGDANLFFINPNGIIFGANARLDVRGSFIGSTADSIAFPNGENFSATNPNVPPLLTIDVPVPIGLVFEGSDRGIILNRGDLKTGQNLTLVGGTILSSGQLSSPGKEIALSTVPAGVNSIVGIAGTGKLLEQTTQSRGQTSSFAFSLPDFIEKTGKTSQFTIDSKGQVRLTGSNLAIAPGDIVLEGTLLQAETVKLSSARNLTLVESQLGTTGDMTLRAKDTVRIQDSLTRPFVAAAGGNLAAQGDKNVKILALNHPESGLISGKDMVLRSPNPVIGDARYWSGGNFRIEKLDSSLGDLFSPDDPIIRASGDVFLNSYEGSSLHIFAGGLIFIPGTVRITGTDTVANSLAEIVTLSDGTNLAIDGSKVPILDLRAGTIAIGSSVIDTGTPTSADILIGKIIVTPIAGKGGTILLTNQYQPNAELGTQFGGITVGLIETSKGVGSTVALDSKGDLTITGAIDASSNGLSGKVILNSAGDINLMNGATVDVRGANGGSIVVNAQNLEMSGGSKLLAGIGEGLGAFGAQAGNVKLKVAEVAAFRQSSGIENRVNQNAIGNAGDINVRAGSISLSEGAFLSATTFGIGNGGDINIDVDGSVRLDGSDSRISTTVDSSAIGNGGNIEIKAKSLSATNGALLNTIIFGATDLAPGGRGNAGDITIQASDSITISGTDNTGFSSGIYGDVLAGADGKASQIDLQANSILLSNGARLSANNFGGGKAGSIDIITDFLAIANGSGVDVRGGGEGSITIDARILELSEGSGFLVGIGQGMGASGVRAGNIEINAAERIKIQGEINFPSFINNTVELGGTGNAGEVIINTKIFEGIGDFILSSGIFGRGNAGKATINATDRVTLEGLEGRASGILSAVAQSGVGNGSDIMINTRSLSLSNSVQLATSTVGQGNAGTIDIKATESVSVNRGSILQAFSAGAGNAGDIIIEAGQGIVAFDGKNTIANTSVGSIPGFVGTGQGGNIIIKSRALSVSNNANLTTTTSGQIGANGLPNAGNIQINASDSVLLSNGSELSSKTSGAGNGGNIKIVTDSFAIANNAKLDASTGGAGQGGTIDLQARSLSLFNESQLITSTVGQGNAGNIKINASESVSVNQGSVLQAISRGVGNAGDIIIDAEKGTFVLDGASLFTNTLDQGLGGDVTINAKDVLIRDGAAVLTGTLGARDGGTLTVNASESVQLFGTSTSLSTNTFRNSRGNAGDATINTKNLLIRDGATVLTGTLGAGDGGTLTVNASESVQLLGTLTDTQSSTGLFTNTFENSTGKAGDLTINTKDLLIRDGALVFTGTLGPKNGGNLTVNASESVQIIGSGIAFSIELFSSLGAQTGNQGDAGDLRITTKNLVIRDGAEISTSTEGTGNGGTLIVNASESIRLSDARTDRQKPTQITTETLDIGNANNLTITTGRLLIEDGAEISATTNGGRGGTITVNADRLETRNGGTLRTTTSATQNAGDIFIRVSENVTLTGTDSGLFANTTEDSSGNGGSIFIDPRTVTISDGATISVNSQGDGIGGDIQIEADSLTLDNGTISAETASTQGGDITLNVQDLLFLRNGSQISTTAGTAQARGDGGNIFIDAGSIVAVPQENSDITANAFLGDGGRIVINTQSIFGIDFRQQLTPLSDITASSQAGTPGEVIINTSGIEPTRGLENLTEERINVEVAQGCRVGASKGGKLSFYNIGRGGVPPSPDDLLNSPATQEWFALESEENNSVKPDNSEFFQETNAITELSFSCRDRNAKPVDR